MYILFGGKGQLPKQSEIYVPVVSRRLLVPSAENCGDFL